MGEDNLNLRYMVNYWVILVVVLIFLVIFGDLYQIRQTREENWVSPCLERAVVKSRYQNQLITTRGVKPVESNRNLHQWYNLDEIERDQLVRQNIQEADIVNEAYPQDQDQDQDQEDQEERVDRYDDLGE